MSSKLYVTQMFLIFGFVALIGVLPAISDALSHMMPQAYADTFRPTTLAESLGDATDQEEAVLRMPESITQTASLDVQGE